MELTKVQKIADLGAPGAYSHVPSEYCIAINNFGMPCVLETNAETLLIDDRCIFCGARYKEVAQEYNDLRRKRYGI